MTMSIVTSAVEVGLVCILEVVLDVAHLVVHLHHNNGHIKMMISSPVFTVTKSSWLTLVHCLIRKSLPFAKSQAEAWQVSSRPSFGFSRMLPSRSFFNFPIYKTRLT